MLGYYEPTSAVIWQRSLNFVNLAVQDQGKMFFLTIFVSLKVISSVEKCFLDLILEGWNGMGHGREVSEGEDICIPMADSY